MIFFDYFKDVLDNQRQKFLIIFFFQNVDYNAQRNNLLLTKNKQNNMITMSQTINIILQPIQQRL